MESQHPSKKKSSVRKYSAKSRTSSGSKQSMTGICRRLDHDLGSMSRSGPHAGSPAARSPAIRSPVSTARKGRRVSQAGGSILERAEKRAAAKDLPPPVRSLLLFGLMNWPKLPLRKPKRLLPRGWRMLVVLWGRLRVLVVASPHPALLRGALINDLNPVWPPAGRASVSRTFRINEGLILEY